MLHTYLVLSGGGEESFPYFAFALPSAWSCRDLALTPFASASCSTPGLRLCVDFFDGGRAVLVLAPNLDHNGALLRQSVCGIDRVFSHSVPVPGCYR